MERSKILYNKYSQPLYRFVLARCKSVNTSEEVVAETFFRYLKAVDDGKEIRNDKAWLFGAAINVMHEQLRDEQKYTELNDTRDISDEKPAETDLFDSNLKEQLLTNLEKVDPVTKEIMLLRIWEEFTYQEIASVVGMKEATIRKRFSRGVQQLKNLMEPEEKKGKKLYVIPIPHLLYGISILKDHMLFILNTAQKSHILSISRKKMNHAQNPLPTEGAKAVGNAVSISKPLMYGLIGTLVVTSIASVALGWQLYSQNADDATTESSSSSVESSTSTSSEESSSITSSVSSASSTVSSVVEEGCDTGYTEVTFNGRSFCHLSSWTSRIENGSLYFGMGNFEILAGFSPEVEIRVDVSSGRQDEQITNLQESVAAVEEPFSHDEFEVYKFLNEANAEYIDGFSHYIVYDELNDQTFTVYALGFHVGEDDTEADTFVQAIF